MTIDEKIAVLQAYKEGKTIEGKVKTTDTWYPIYSPAWNFIENDYRVKPEPHYRPFENVEEVMEAIKEHGDWITRIGRFFKIIKVGKTGIVSGDCPNAGVDTFEACMELEYKFLDGTPFGKLVDENK